MALGAQAGDIARRVTLDVLAMVAMGAAAGLALGMAAVRYIEKHPVPGESDRSSRARVSHTGYSGRGRGGRVACARPRGPHRSGGDAEG